MRRTAVRAGRPAGLALTGSGTAVGVASACCLLAGTLLGYQELQVLGAAGFIGLLLALGWALPASALLVDRLVEPQRVARGDPAVGVLHVRHVGRFPVGASTAADRVASEWVSVDVPGLRPGGQRALTYRLPTTRRGHYRVGPLTLTRADPLRLVRRDVGAGPAADLWVHPRVLPVSLAPLGRTRDLDGPSADQAMDGSITFRSLREYVAGDDLRRVHWRSTARTGTLMVRESVDPSRPDVALIIDDRANAYATEEHLEQAVDLTASLAVSLLAAGFRCQVTSVTGRTVGAGSRTADLIGLLDALAELPAQHDGAYPFGDAVAALPGGSAAVLVSGRPTEHELELLLAARDRYRFLLALCVTDGSAPRCRGLHVLDAPTASLLVRRWELEAGR